MIPNMVYLVQGKLMPGLTRELDFAIGTPYLTQFLKYSAVKYTVLENFKFLNFEIKFVQMKTSTNN